MKKLTIFIALTLVGCPPIQDPDVPAPNPPPDTDLIGQMCTHLRTLGCEEGEDVYNDDLEGPVDVPNQSCEDFHKDLQDQGVFVNPRCVLESPDCASIEDYRAKNPDTCR